jgi:hypothetical protein
MAQSDTRDKSRSSTQKPGSKSLRNKALIDQQLKARHKLERQIGPIIQKHRVEMVMIEEEVCHFKTLEHEIRFASRPKDRSQSHPPHFRHRSFTTLS